MTLHKRLKHAIIVCILDGSFLATAVAYGVETSHVCASAIESRYSLQIELLQVSDSPFANDLSTWDLAAAKV